MSERTDFGGGESGPAPSVARNAFWRFLEISGTELISFGFMVLFARILAPDDFGVVAISTGVIVIAQSVIYHGLAEQIIQVDILDQSTFSNALLLNLGLGLMLTLLVLGLAWPLAGATGKPELGPVMASLSPVLLFMSIAGIYQARLRREMRFSGLTCRAVVSIIAGGSVGLVLAISGFGVWSLVGMQLTHAISGCAILVLFSKWSLQPAGSWDRVRDMGLKAIHIASTCLIDTICRSITPILLGMFLSSTVVGLYFIANRLMSSLSMLTFMSVNELCLPVLSRVRRDRARFDEAIYTTIRITTLFCLPAFVGLALIADPIVMLVFGNHWKDAVMPLRYLGVAGIFPAWIAISAQILIAAGRPEQALRLNLTLAAAALLLIPAGAMFGLNMAVGGIILANVLVLPRAFGYLKSDAQLDMRRLVADQLPMMVAAGAMVVAVLSVGTGIAGHNSWLRLLVMLLAGGCSYTLVVFILAPGFAMQIVRQLGAAIMPTRFAI
ncbi:MAG: oligosaccharide flippase family protein [Geminicoccaceae bacterium]|nr:oligosaccharide flippase family protein [Geminicoccaceae bacterium]